MQIRKVRKYNDDNDVEVAMAHEKQRPAAAGVGAKAPRLPARITDVATRAGVSIKTVSRVVNDEKGVLPETRERVIAAVRELGFVPDSRARSLKRGETDTIGIIIDAISDPFFAAFVSVIEDLALEQGLSVLFASTGYDAAREREQLDRLTGHRLRGLILAPVALGSTELLALRQRFPVVCVDRGRAGIDSIVVDDFGATVDAVRSLIALGHRRIGFVGEATPYPTVEARFDGFRAAFAEADLQFDPSLVVAHDRSRDRRANAATALLDRPDAPTAVFCASSPAAIGLIAGIRENVFSDARADLVRRIRTRRRHLPRHHLRRSRPEAHRRGDLPSPPRARERPRCRPRAHPRSHPPHPSRLRRTAAARAHHPRRDRSSMIPELLPPNPVQHFYRGGDRIAALRGIVPETDHQPEEWLAATVSRFGDPVTGLAVTTDGAYLRDLVAAEPAAWVGPEIGRDASDVGILVKLLDARQRLPVHVHPQRGFAMAHLDCPYGKTEAWYVLDTEADCAVYVGWNQAIDRVELDRRRDAQDSEWMLAHMNRVVVREGMGVLVPAGTAHAIDGGIFVAEVQEPTDFSILLEWSVTTSTREESHLDLGFDTVMPAVSTDHLPEEELSKLISLEGTRPPSPMFRSLLPAVADPYFRLSDAAACGGRTDTRAAGFAVVLVTDGNGALVGRSESFPVERGQVLAVPHAFGDWHLEADAAVLVGEPGRGWPATLHEGGVQ